MRVLNLSMLYPPMILGGAEKSVALLSEALRAEGHTVAAACITPDDKSVEERNGVRVYRMPHETDFWPEEWPQHSTLERGWRRFKQQFNYKLEAHFGEVIDDFRPDIINTHSLVDVSTRVWVAAASRNIPIVHTLRDYDLACGNAAMFKSGHRCQSRHLKCRVFTYKKYDHHHLVSAVVGVGSEILSNHVSMGYFGHVPQDLRRVIWNAAVVDGLDAAYTKPALEGDITFGYLGRINVEKGVMTLIDACKRLPHSGWRLVVAGKPPADMEKFVTAAAGLPISFPGFIAPRAFFDQIDCLIVPSIWPEPLPRTILESYAAGVPSIGARSGGIPDLIGADNGDWLFEPDNAAELAGKMMGVITAGREKLPGRADFSAVLSETTPQLVARRYQALYDEVLRSRAGL